MPGMTAAALAAHSFHQRGDSIDLPPAPSGGYTAGDAIVVGGFVGIINVSVPEGKPGSATIVNAYAMANSDITPSAGDPVDINLTNQNVVATTTGDAKAGTVLYDVADAADPVVVLLNQMPIPAI